MEFRTKVEIPPTEEGLDYESRICVVGSCFAENMGQRLAYYRFRTEVNPCGIVYNPLSVADVLRFMMERRHFTEADLLYNDGKWVSLHHHGRFSAATMKECLERINGRMEEAAEGFADTDLLILTFGTAWVYRYRESGEVVANCHKFPAADFERSRLAVEDIMEAYRPLLSRLHAGNSKLRILFTVSPIRHWKDGAHGNQLSKAVLLLAVERLVKEFPFASYFPSYEIVMDELRDYRFYAEDMLHVSPMAVDYIWERFTETWISPSAVPLMKRIDKLNKSLAHRPFSTDSEAWHSFHERVKKEIEALRSLNQNIDFSSVPSSESVD